MKRIWLALFLCLLCLPAKAVNQGFIPCSAQTISVSGTTSTPIQLSNCGGTVLLWNVTSQEVFYNYGTSSGVAATTSNYSIPGNSFVVLFLGLGQYYLAAITASSTSTLRVTQGVTP